jgi:hypothetical protein
MRALFSLVGLVVVLLVVMSMTKTQLQAVAPGAASVAPGAAAPTLPEQSRQMQHRAVQGVERALEQGAARASAATP